MTITFCELFLRMEHENRRFPPLCCNCRPLAEERQAIST